MRKDNWYNEGSHWIWWGKEVQDKCCSEATWKIIYSVVQRKNGGLINRKRRPNPTRAMHRWRSGNAAVCKIAMSWFDSNTVLQYEVSFVHVHVGLRVVGVCERLCDPRGESGQHAHNVHSRRSSDDAWRVKKKIWKRCWQVYAGVVNFSHNENRIEKSERKQKQMTIYQYDSKTSGQVV